MGDLISNNSEIVTPGDGQGFATTRLADMLT